MSSYTRQQLESWLKTITTKGRVLDIGGSQNPVLKRLDHTKLYHDEYKILDLENPHECKQEPDYKFDLNNVFDCWKEDDVHYCGSFDMAFCLEVSEYWWNPVQALKNINALLKQGGELYISFHTFYPVHNPIEQDYLRYTTEGVVKLLKETGFRIEEIKGRTTENDDILKTWWDMEKMRPAKDYIAHDWIGCLVKAIKL